MLVKEGKLTISGQFFHTEWNIRSKDMKRNTDSIVYEEKAINQTWMCVAHLWCNIYGQSGRLPPRDVDSSQ